jgi:hypothetical protein
LNGKLALSHELPFPGVNLEESNNRTVAFDAKGGFLFVSTPGKTSGEGKIYYTNLGEHPVRDLTIADFAALALPPAAMPGGVSSLVVSPDGQWAAGIVSDLAETRGVHILRREGGAWATHHFIDASESWAKDAHRLFWKIALRNSETGDFSLFVVTLKGRLVEFSPKERRRLAMTERIDPNLEITDIAPDPDPRSHAFAVVYALKPTLPQTGFGVRKVPVDIVRFGFGNNKLLNHDLDVARCYEAEVTPLAADDSERSFKPRESEANWQRVAWSDRGIAVAGTVPLVSDTDFPPPQLGDNFVGFAIDILTAGEPCNRKARLMGGVDAFSDLVWYGDRLFYGGTQPSLGVYDAERNELVDFRGPNKLDLRGNNSIPYRLTGLLRDGRTLVFNTAVLTHQSFEVDLEALTVTEVALPADRKAARKALPPALDKAWHEGKITAPFDEISLPDHETRAEFNDAFKRALGDWAPDVGNLGLGLNARGSEIDRRATPMGQVAVDADDPTERRDVLGDFDLFGRDTQGLNPRYAVLGSTYKIRVVDQAGQLCYDDRTSYQIYQLNVVESRDDVLLITFDSDGVIRTYKIVLPEAQSCLGTKLEPLVNIYIGPDSQWIMWTASGFFVDGGAGADLRKELRWRIMDLPGEHINADNLAEYFYCPQLVQRTWRAHSEKKALEELQAQLGNSTPTSICRALDGDVLKKIKQQIERGGAFTVESKELANNKLYIDFTFHAAPNHRIAYFQVEGGQFAPSPFPVDDCSRSGNSYSCQDLVDVDMKGICRGQRVAFAIQALDANKHPLKTSRLEQVDVSYGGESAPGCALKRSVWALIVGADYRGQQNTAACSKLVSSGATGASAISAGLTFNPQSPLDGARCDAYLLAQTLCDDSGSEDRQWRKAHLAILGGLPVAPSCYDPNDDPLSEAMGAYQNASLSRSSFDHAVSALLAMKDRIAPNDYVIVFLSGHGTLGSTANLSSSSAYQPHLQLELIEHGQRDVNLGTFMQQVDDAFGKNRIRTIFFIDVCRHLTFGVSSLATATNSPLQAHSLKTALSDYAAVYYSTGNGYAAWEHDWSTAVPEFEANSSDLYANRRNEILSLFKLNAGVRHSLFALALNRVITGRAWSTYLRALDLPDATPKTIDPGEMERYLNETVPKGVERAIRAIQVPNGFWNGIVQANDGFVHGAAD